MRQSTDHIFRVALEFIGGKEFRSASNELLGIRRNQLTALSVEDKAELLFHQSHCDYMTGCYHAALIKVKASCRIVEANVGISDRLGPNKNLEGLIRLALGDLNGATECFNEAYVYRKKFKQFEELWAPLLNLALLAFLKGNLGHTLDLLEKALEYAIKHNGDSQQVACILMKARCLLFNGFFVEAEATHELTGSRGCSNQQKGDLANIQGLISLHRMEYRSCVSRLSLSRRIYTRSKYLRGVAVCLEYLGLNEYFAGNYKKAKEYYEQVLDMPEPTASAVAQTLRMLTDVHIAEGHWSLAKQTAAKADFAINKISERIELGALWRAYGQIHAYDNNRDEARAFFTKSIELLRQLGARYELALSHFDAGRSTMFSASERAEHLRTARTLFVDMDVPKRVVQVNAAIKQHEAEFPAEAMTARHSREIGPRHSREGGNPAKSSLTLKASKARTIIAVSESMKRILALADRVKDTEMTILITGETGTGKDLLADYIHRTSNRAGKPWRVINSAAMPESLLEAELFGFTRGTYSGADADRPGLIELTDGGTFCFDEVGETPLALQAKLLRLLDFKVVRRLGAAEDRHVDVRFIALSNRNLQQMVREGSFRSDLYHRLCQVPIHLLPLRERCDDIAPLAALLLDRHGLHVIGDTPQLLAAMHEHLIAYEWPGNVRELNAIIMRVATLLDENGSSDVVKLLRQQLGAQDTEGSERRRLFEALRRHDGNKSKVADELGLPRTTLNSQIKKYNL